MANIASDVQSLSLTDEIENAIQRFKTKQTEADLNWTKWMQAQINRCKEAADEDTSEKAQDSLAATSFQTSSWDLLKSRRNIQTLEDLLPQASQQATKPPVAQAVRDSFFKQLEDAINRELDASDTDADITTVPEDYAALLAITDGIHDTDLRRSGVCGIDGIASANIAHMVPTDFFRLPASKYLFHLGWDLDAGILLGTGEPAAENWLVYYYCRRNEETANGPKIRGGEIREAERQWKWRLFYKEPEKLQHSFLDPMVFNGLVEWLDWYGDWWHRVSKEYPAWYRKCVTRVELLYPEDAEDEDDGRDLGPE